MIDYIITKYQIQSIQLKRKSNRTDCSQMRAKSTRIRNRVPKKLPIMSQQQTQACNQIHSQPSQLDGQIQQSNSQLSQTLSTWYHPKQIVCRQHQKQLINQFIKDCIASLARQHSRVLYISGVPGVGKTVSTMQIVHHYKKMIYSKKAAFRYINAMSLTTPTKIYSLINRQLYSPQKDDIRQNPPIKLTLKFKADVRIKFLIIDQIDYLYTKNQNILYNLFQWCNSQETKLCSIIIANTMDFTQRLLPKIASRMGQNRLVFKPYSQHQVQQIIQDRLMKSNRFSKDSIIYACKKMSSFTSDVRKLLYILRQSLSIKTHGIITTEDMCSCWKKFAQQTGDLWQEKIPSFYQNIMVIIKDKGGMCNFNTLLQRMCGLNQYHNTELMIAIKQMEEMGLVRVKQRKIKCLKTYEITLLKI